MTQKTTAQNGLSPSSPLINVKLDPQHFIEKLRQLHAWQQQQQESLLRQQQEQLAHLKRRQSASSVSPLGPLNTQVARIETGGPGLGAAAGKENIPVRPNPLDSAKGPPPRSHSSPTRTTLATVMPDEVPAVSVPERRSPESFSGPSSVVGGGEESRSHRSHDPPERDDPRTSACADDRPLHSVLGKL